jgi:hypothetical protein
MTNTYTVERRRASASSAPTTTTVLGHPAAANGQRPAVVVPESQRYYWTRAWQQNERVAVEEVARGKGRRFDNPADAIRWLLSSED